MIVSREVRESYGEAIRLIGPFLTVHVAVRLISAALLVPFAGAAIAFTLARSGQDVLADQDIALFLLTPWGLAMALLVGGIAIVAAVLDVAVMSAAIRSREVRPFAAARDGLATILPQLPQLLWFAILLLLRITLLALPFLAAAGATAWWLLGEFDINYYLTAHPPEFQAAVFVIGGLVLLLLGLLVYRLTGWAIALHLVIFGGRPASKAFRESTRRMSGHRWGFIARIALWLAIAAILGGVTAGVFGAALGGLPDILANRLSLLAPALVVVLILWGLANTVIATLAGGALADILTETAGSILGQVPAGPADAAPFAGAGLRTVAGVVAAVTLAGLILGGFLIEQVEAGGDVEIIAHRGGATSAPENTIPAFEQGIADGADWIEIDVQETADGVVIVTHDSDFMKQAGNPLKVWDATLDDLAEIDMGSWFDPAFASARVPTLSEVLELSRDRAGVLIELKYYGHDVALEARVAELVEAANMAEQVAVMSLKYEGVQKMHALRPDWRTGVLAARAVGDLTALETDFIAVNVGQVSPRLIASAEARGKDVYAWTVNDPVTMSRMISMGVDGLITDDPGLVRDVIAWREDLSTPERLSLWLADRFNIGVDAMMAGIQGR